jgi:vacuolar-type H+-ATPase subunit I/STV1
VVIRLVCLIVFGSVMLGLSYALGSIEAVLRPLEWSGAFIYLAICGLIVMVSYLAARLIDHADSRPLPPPQ